jgi:hypothetical protein
MGRRKTDEPKPKKEKVAGKKRGRSGYIFYSMERRPVLKAAEPDLAFGELTSRIAAEWKGLDETARAPYLKQAADDKERLAAGAE